MITVSCAFPPATNKSLHAMLLKVYPSEGEPLSLFPQLKHTTHPLTGLTSTVWSPPTTIEEGQWVHFSHMEEFNSICTSMSGAIASNSPSAAICHMVTNVKILVGKFNFYFHTTTVLPLMLWVNIVNLGGITSGEALIQHLSYNKV